MPSIKDINDKMKGKIVSLERRQKDRKCLRNDEMKNNLEHTNSFVPQDLSVHEMADDLKLVLFYLCTSSSPMTKKFSCNLICDRYPRMQ